MRRNSPGRSAFSERETARCRRRLKRLRSRFAATRASGSAGGCLRRCAAMVRPVSATSFMASKHDDKPPGKDDIDACRRCDLWERATQGVGGEGSHKARLMLVGEQPGDEEDQQGKPFVGPAGKLLRHLLSQAGIAPADFYLTNAVKHFSWEPRGKRRMHKTPTPRQMSACHEWLEREIGAVRPTVIVALEPFMARPQLTLRWQIGRAHV